MLGWSWIEHVFWQDLRSVVQSKCTWVSQPSLSLLVLAQIRVDSRSWTADHRVSQQVTSATRVPTQAVHVGLRCDSLLGAWRGSGEREDKRVNLLKDSISWRIPSGWNGGNGHQKKATSICTSIVQSCVKKNIVKLKATFSAGNDNCHILPLKAPNLRLDSSAEIFTKGLITCVLDYFHFFFSSL